MSAWIEERLGPCGAAGMKKVKVSVGLPERVRPSRVCSDSPEGRVTYPKNRSVAGRLVKM